MPDPLPESMVTQEFCEELIQQIEKETKREEEKQLIYKGILKMIL